MMSPVISSEIARMRMRERLDEAARARMAAGARPAGGRWRRRAGLRLVRMGNALLVRDEARALG